MGKISGILTVRRRMNWQKYCKKLIKLVKSRKNNDTFLTNVYIDERPSFI